MSIRKSTPPQPHVKRAPIVLPSFPLPKPSADIRTAPQPGSDAFHQALDVSRKENILADLQNRFAYHGPKGDQVARYANVRAVLLDAAKFIATVCPESPERDRAIEKLEEAGFLANASIARNE